MTKLLVVVDIDGTISDATDRFRVAGPAPDMDVSLQAYLSWVDTVNSNMVHDEPVAGMSSLLRSLYHSQAHVVYLTNREEKHREATEDWLICNGFPLYQLLMRETGSYSEAVQYKGTVIKNLKDVFGFTEVIVIDDDESGKIEQLCKKQGYTFLHAKSGGRL